MLSALARRPLSWYASFAMLSVEPQSGHIILRTIYEDLPDMVEIETRVVAGDWSGTACAYASPDVLKQKAQRLADWAKHPQDDCVLEAGADTGIGWLRLRFYVIDSAGHVVCHVQMSERDWVSGRLEGVRRLSLEIPTEPGLIERFAQELPSIVHTIGAEAVLGVRV